MTVRNLLLIESDDQLAGQVEQLLRSGESLEAQHELFEIQRAPSLESGLAVLEDRPIDVILLDNALPDCSGSEAIKAIQSSGDSTPIILYTDVSAGELVLHTVQPGAQDYIFRGHVTANELVHCLLHAIERQQRISTEATLGDVREQQSRMGALQAHLLPHEAPTIPGYQIAGRSEPAAIAGGDYFDYLQLPNGKLGIVIADVSGHELASSLIIAGLRRCIRTCAHLSLEIDEIMLQANHGVCEDVMEGQFVVAMLAQIDPEEDAIRYLTAGHHGYLLTPENQMLDLATPGVPLGVLPEEEFTISEPKRLQPGSLFVSFTDGIWEAMTPARQQWGLDTLLNRIKEYRERSAEEMVAQLFSDMRAHCAPATHQDDAAIVVVKKL